MPFKNKTEKQNTFAIRRNMWKACKAYACNNPPHQQKMKSYAHMVKDEERKKEESTGGEKKRDREKKKKKYGENDDE
jgi:hypothetical protein